MRTADGSHAAHDLLVGQLVVERVDVSAHVARVDARAVVQVGVEERQKVHVVKDKARPVVVAQRLHIADVEQHGSVERQPRHLGH